MPNVDSFFNSHSPQNLRKFNRETNIPEVFRKVPYLIKVSGIHSDSVRSSVNVSNLHFRVSRVRSNYGRHNNVSNLNFRVSRVRSNYGKHTFKFVITKT